MSWRGTTDPAFALVGDNVAGYTDVFSALRNEEHGVEMTIDEIAIETPVELSLRVDARGYVEIGCAPPLYRVATTIEPVFHTLRIRAVALVTHRG